MENRNDAEDRMGEYGSFWAEFKRRVDWTVVDGQIQPVPKGHPAAMSSDDILKRLHLRRKRSMDGLYRPMLYMLLYLLFIAVILLLVLVFS